jgi:hypothetical protein
MKSAILPFERVTTGFPMLVACAMMAIAASPGHVPDLARFILEQPAEWTEVLIRFSA